MSEIRAATLFDLPGAYRVCLQTGDSGRDATSMYRDPDLLGHVYVGPYIVGQPDLALVISDRDGVGGYLLAAEDTREFGAWAEAHWWPALRLRYPASEGDSADDQVIRLLHAPPRSPDIVVADYPAHLHVDLLPRLQGHSHGRALVGTLLVALRARASPGVHLEVGADNGNAIAFYRHLGFTELERSEASLFMGMRLS